MLRALPFLIIFMSVMIGSKILDVIDIIPSHLAVQVHAAEDNGATDEKQSQTEKPEAVNQATTTDVQKVEQEDQKAVAEVEQQPQTFFTSAEIEVLQELAKRRQELDDREGKLSIKESSLNVLEDSIKEKLEDLYKMQQNMALVVDQYNKHEEEKVARLVKIYESMKPVEAAAIFERLDDDVLIEVASRMKEAKIALILAKMDPGKAKELTMELANRGKVVGLGGK